MDCRYAVDRGSVIIGVDLLHQSQTVLVQVNEDNKEKTLLFEEQFSYQQLKQQDEAMGSTWNVLCESLKNIF